MTQQQTLCRYRRTCDKFMDDYCDEVFPNCSVFRRLANAELQQRLEQLRERRHIGIGSCDYETYRRVRSCSAN